MNCPTCGAQMRISETRKTSELSKAMNEQRRVRKCAQGHPTDTVEVTRGELQSLRVQAHMKGASA